ncbi:MAG: hypothetical protein ACE5IA_05625 [Dehalococcoidia bacterium]
MSTTGMVRDLSDDQLERQVQAIEAQAVDLVDSGAQVVMIGGNPLFTRLGPGNEHVILDPVQQKVKVPVSAHIIAEMSALRALGIHKVVLATPFEEPLYLRMERFLAESGFEVVNCGGLGIRHNADIDQLPEYAAYRLAKRLYYETPEADGILITCPRWPTIEHIELLERETGKPVVTSAQAFTWHALSLLHIHEPVEGYGELLRRLATHTAADLNSWSPQ